jgi:hypothetical protein
MSGVLAPPTTASMPGLVLRLEALAHELDGRRIALERARDSRCVFTCAYVLITRRLARELEHAGYLDASWIVELAESFGGLYLEALDASASGRSAGPAWDCVFEAIDRKHSSVLEDLVFSMTAHIVHDLPAALGRVGFDGADGSHIHDFHAVNDAMGHGMDEIELAISRRYAPWVRRLDQLGGPYSRILTSYGIRMARGLAWYNALRIADPPSSLAARDATARNVSELVDQVLRPPVWTLRIVLRGMRFVVGVLRRWPKDPVLA